MPSTRLLALSKGFQFASVLFSGLCFYFGFSLNGNWGWLIWIAPILILYISLQVMPGKAFLIAFIAYLIGRISWLPYLMSLMPAVVAILFTLILPLIFALIVIGSRKIVLKSQNWFSSLAFPVFFTAFEWILFIFSKDGTAASIAYTQSSYLPVIQIASITGILGITFLITFFPSVIAIACFFKQNNKNITPLVGVLTILLAVSLLYGWIRLNQPETGEPLILGLVTVDESAYKGVYGHDPVKENKLTDLYLLEVSGLADQGAKVILLPEKAIIVTDSTAAPILQKFIQLAMNRQVQIIIGGTRQRPGFYLNNAWVISNRGKLLADYQKVNLFIGEAMDGCRPGNKTGIFNPGSTNEGIAICKDLDFQQFILGYSKKKPSVLYVPAWDFIVDGWLHARMAILRSVEGGFSMVRNARQGRLTLSDWRGKVLSDANSESGHHTILLGNLSVEPHPTIYAKAGDWFGLVNGIAAIGFIFFMIKKRKT